MSGLFLPFTPNGKATELRAIEVKRHLGYGPREAVDPAAAASRVPLRLVDAGIIRQAAPELARALFVDGAQHWSGVGLGESPDDGVPLVLLNPAHAPTRQRATLMEEIVHIVLKHPKSKLSCGLSGDVWMRSHDSTVEDEAYTVGAACLLPYPALFRAIRDGNEGVTQIAIRLGLSSQYIEFRIKTAGLLRLFRSRRSQSA